MLIWPLRKHPYSLNSTLSQNCSKSSCFPHGLHMILTSTHRVSPIFRWYLGKPSGRTIWSQRQPWGVVERFQGPLALECWRKRALETLSLLQPRGLRCYWWTPFWQHLSTALANCFSMFALSSFLVTLFPIFITYGVCLLPNHILCLWYLCFFPI